MVLRQGSQAPRLVLLLKCLFCSVRGSLRRLKGHPCLAIAGRAVFFRRRGRVGARGSEVLPRAEPTRYRVDMVGLPSVRGLMITLGLMLF